MNPETLMYMNFKAHERGLVLRSEPERRRPGIVASYVHPQSELRQVRHQSSLCRPAGAGMRSGVACDQYFTPDGVKPASCQSLSHSNQSQERQNQSLSHSSAVKRSEKSGAPSIARRVGWLLDQGPSRSRLDASRSDLDESAAIKPNQTGSNQLRISQTGSNQSDHTGSNRGVESRGHLEMRVFRFFQFFSVFFTPPAGGVVVL